LFCLFRFSINKKPLQRVEKQSNQEKLLKKLTKLNQGMWELYFYCTGWTGRQGIIETSKDVF
jgi:hypothetical protein